jgi:hypothetical protein
MDLICLRIRERALLECILVCKDHGDEGGPSPWSLKLECTCSFTIHENLANHFCKGHPTNGRRCLIEPQDLAWDGCWLCPMRDLETKLMGFYEKLMPQVYSMWHVKHHERNKSWVHSLLGKLIFCCPIIGLKKYMHMVNWLILYREKCSTLSLNPHTQKGNYQRWVHKTWLRYKGFGGDIYKKHNGLGVPLYYNKCYI